MRASLNRNLGGGAIACFLALLIPYLLAGLAFAQQQESRVALVIGNGAYKSSPLKNPVNDSKDVAAKLRSLGFTVVERNNLVVKQIGSTLREFRSTLKPGSVALVYYAGHGVQIKGENYLPAVDAEIGGEEDVPNQSLAMRQIMDVLGDARTRLNLVFLDACRDNPYARSFRSSASGLSKENAPSGTLISFATRPGSVASDGTGRNGLYTGALLAAMNEPNRPIEQVLKSVVSTVKAGSKNQQEPWMEGSIEGEFCFSGCKPVAVAQNTTSEMSDNQREEKFWDEAKVIGNREAFEAYLSSYPTGRYAALAKASIVRLVPLSVPATPPSNPNHLAQQSSVQSTVIQQPKAGAVFKDCDDCPEMVMIPAGNFLMGTQDKGKDETPQHPVSIKGFALGRFEVTQLHWSLVMSANPSQFKSPNNPVENVSWDDIQEFLRRLNSKTGRIYRLPSEAEWEYAARAGSQTIYHFGDKADELNRYAWFQGNSGSVTHPVGEKLPNAFGLYDMHGNVWEWTDDCWNRDYSGAPTDGSAWIRGACGRRVLRGGSHFIGPDSARSAYRSSNDTSARSFSYGFRLARTLP